MKPPPNWEVKLGNRVVGRATDFTYDFAGLSPGISPMLGVAGPTVRTITVKSATPAELDAIGALGDVARRDAAKARWTAPPWLEQLDEDEYGLFDQTWTLLRRAPADPELAPSTFAAEWLRARPWVRPDEVTVAWSGEPRFAAKVSTLATFRKLYEDDVPRTPFLDFLGILEVLVSEAAKLLGVDGDVSEDGVEALATFRIKAPGAVEDAAFYATHRRQPSETALEAARATMGKAREGLATGCADLAERIPLSLSLGVVPVDVGSDLLRCRWCRATAMAPRGCTAEFVLKHARCAVELIRGRLRRRQFLDR